ncbi:alpha/beta hydrolase [Roseisolibacter sp. H3M3-2]|uniref:alpha/beta fold hydrolase n=1 Tax=Roseisolibacter sp. H3M3-2 TaxID=3031323 RepID=UPI0023DA796F|nr:alpha/beta hydrolase [Roseisolibacter sp. H3M3-2]MDF1501836.1 alpha/beta hydrolase [Roseisolibacter sp. H3M3-2]
MADGEWAGAATGAAALMSGSEGGTRWRDAWAPGAGVRLHVVEGGEGAPVVLLHGFPDFWYAWHRQLPALAAAGFRAIAPDLRGYNLSDRPRRVEDYRLPLLADDVAALIRGVAGGRAHVVGHDWGGGVAWHLAARHPEVVDRLAIVNAPHPARYRELLRTPAQALRAWYLAAVQLPVLPEALLGAGDLAPLRAVWRRMRRAPGGLSAREEAAYAAAFADRSARWAALAYYRALARHGAPVPAERRTIPHRTLLLWGMRDPALVPGNAEGLERWLPALSVVRFPDAGHWPMADAPAAFDAALLAFLRGA